MSEFESKGQRFVALCMLGLLLFNYPILALFNVSGALFGVPVLYAYIFIAWAVLIALMAFVAESRPLATWRGGGGMLQGTTIIFTSFAYLGLLFAIAYYADQRADAGRSVIASPYIYSLSLAVYATAWTFYGSVGRAASDGVGFLPIYIGPTLMIALWWVVMRKILRI